MSLRMRIDPPFRLSADLAIDAGPMPAPFDLYGCRNGCEVPTPRRKIVVVAKSGVDGAIDRLVCLARDVVYTPRSLPPSSRAGRALRAQPGRAQRGEGSQNTLIEDQAMESSRLGKVVAR